MEFTKAENTIEAHRMFWEQQKGTQSSEDLIVLFKDPEKLAFFSDINPEVLSSFWTIDDEYDRVKYKDIWLNNIKGIKHTELNINGKFISYLTEKGKNNVIFKDISHHLTVSGGLPASMYPAFAEKHQDYSISDYEFRILSTYLILSQDESIEDKLDAYYKSKKFKHINAGEPVDFYLNDEKIDLNTTFINFSALEGENDSMNVDKDLNTIRYYTEKETGKLLPLQEVINNLGPKIDISNTIVLIHKKEGLKEGITTCYTLDYWIDENLLVDFSLVSSSKIAYLDKKESAQRVLILKLKEQGDIFIK